MKIITVRLSKSEFDFLDAYIRRKKYPSKSEFIRNLILQAIDADNLQKEAIGWILLAELSIKEL